MVKVDRKYKVAQYGQWDGYPSGTGKDLLTFLRSTDLTTLADRCRVVKVVTDKEVSKMWKECGGSNDTFKNEYPSLHRDTGWKILQIIQESKIPVMVSLDLEFVADSLFCEWAYVIDFDLKTFEVYKGFNEHPLNAKDRFFSLQKRTRDGYFPVRREFSYKLSALPTVEQFLKDCGNE